MSRIPVLEPKAHVMAKGTDELRLGDGAQIVIIGAGPAGSFFAHFARELAQQQGLAVTISICDGKNFARQGPTGCNMCAGVISGPLAAQLERLGYMLPDGRVQRRVDGYFLQTPAGGFALDHPSGRPNIRTVFRGNGPRFAPQSDNISFDDFLLDRVKAEGVEMVPFPVQEIRLPADRRERIALTYGDKKEQGVLEADLVVGAFGLNTALLEKVRALGFGYRPPLIRRVGQAELPATRDWIERRLQNRIVVLAAQVGAVELAVFTPKADHVTLTLLGHEDIERSDLEAFFAHPIARTVLPSDWTLPRGYCHCFPRLPVTAAKHPFTDRFVLIGDASFSRYYKNGIESALVTARLAAETAFRQGVSAAAFEQGYLRPATKLIVHDNFYGRLLFRLPDLIAKGTVLAEAQARIVSGADSDYAARLLRQSLWNVLTGDLPYRNIFWRMLDPRLVARLAATSLSIYRERWSGRRRRSPEA